MNSQFNDPVSQAERFIKGRIAEVIFQSMFEQMKTAIILPYGYEHTAPVLAQYYKDMDALVKKELRRVGNIPDFILIAADDKKKALTVEVKYRKNFSQAVAKKVAKEVYDKWPKCWLFLVTQEGFYFGNVEDVQKNGQILPLSTNWVSKKLQEQYLELLRKYINISPNI